VSGLVASGSRTAGAATALAVTAVLGLAAMTSLLDEDCAGLSAAPSGQAASSIQTDYLELYRHAGRTYQVPWTVPAAIGAMESDHGRSSARVCAPVSTPSAAAPGRCSST
jgi:hypothetical protein